ncbi:TPA: hypothetical protein ACF5GV_002859, partial [Staphylococcus aureus]
MAINEQQIQKLSEKIEEILQSTNFGQLLETTDAYLYEEMVRDAFEQKDMPEDIDTKDVNHELILKSNKSADSWAELL